MTSQRFISHVILFGVAALTVALIRLPWDQLTTPLPVPIIVSGISTPEPYTSDHSAQFLRLAPPDTTSITRVTDLHTDKPNATRPTVITYTIVAGDTPFSKANRFGLKPETILWGNPLLPENAEALTIGTEINILPVDRVLHYVAEGDTVERLQLLYGVPVQEIVSYPGNDFPEWIYPLWSVTAAYWIHITGRSSMRRWQKSWLD